MARPHPLIRAGAAQRTEHGEAPPFDPRGGSSPSCHGGIGGADKLTKLAIIPLPSRALEILTEAKALNDGSDLIFAGTRYGKPLSDMTLSKLVKENGFTADIHGFRTSFKTWTQERTTTAREVSEAALAHTIQNKAEAAYARSDLFEKRRALMERWQNHLSAKAAKIHLIG
ncbi:hypothetical protein [Pacificibacter sp. AS14]|uniref:tyrosine-type recombinase/integrase n=1 Tax=Pacificibacter sp. AS14 TaxID=3135785 RepID=UPI0031799663